MRQFSIINSQTMEPQPSNIISVPSKISDNNHQLVLQDLIYVNNKTYALNLFSPRPSLYFKIQIAQTSTNISARSQSPNQLLCLLGFYILLSIETQHITLQFIKKVLYTQNIIQLQNYPSPCYYKEGEIALATRIYFSKIIDDFSRRSVDERLMLEPQQNNILHVWIIILRNILYRSLKTQHYKNYNSVITKNDIDKLVRIIKIKSSEYIRLRVDRKFTSTIEIIRKDSAQTERRLIGKQWENRSQVSGSNNSSLAKGFRCCCNLI